MTARSRRVRVRVPATTSNLGSAFDVLGMALTLYNEVELEQDGTLGPCRVEIRGEGQDTLPTGETNEVARLLREGTSVERYRIRVRMRNAIPVARGLGSSAAARVAALMLRLRTLGKWPELAESVLSQATALEGHPDNVVPALLGGLRLSVNDGGRLVHVALREPRPSDLKVVVCIPDFELPTAKARKVLPARVKRADAVFNSGRVGLLAYAFQTRRYSLLKTAMQDALHQPYRRPLVPGMGQVLEAADAAGAFGAALSGAGPTMLAFAPPANAQRVGRAMRKAFLARRIESRALVLDVDGKGAVMSGLP